jgi:phthalate 4,5-cis-dihydrodiol dehydrogenase
MHPEYEVLGFSGAEPGSAEAIGAEFGRAAFSSLEDLLAHAPDAVILATPHATHAPLAVQVLEADIPVLVEKPLAITTEQCDELIGVEAASTAFGMVGHLMRWAPAHQQARTLVETGAIGRIVAAESRRIVPWGADARRPWQTERAAGGGMWLIQGVHVIDQLTWLLGTRPTSIIGLSETRSHPEQDADDLGVAIAQFGQVPVTITVAGTRSTASDVVTQLIGTHGLLRVSHRGLLEVDDGSGVRNRSERSSTNPWNAMLARELTEFARVVHGQPTELDFYYGRHIVATVDAVRRSSMSGRWEQI